MVARLARLTHIFGYNTRDLGHSHREIQETFPTSGSILHLPNVILEQIDRNDVCSSVGESRMKLLAKRDQARESCDPWFRDLRVRRHHGTVCEGGPVTGMLGAPIERRRTVCARYRGQLDGSV